jgi:hypothetical protein
VTFDELYPCLINCFSAIQVETDWDTKSRSEAYGLLKKIEDSNFIAAFQSILYLCNFVKDLNAQLQGSTIDTANANENVQQVKEVLQRARDGNDFAEKVFPKMEEMAQISGEAITIPRRCGRQTYRNNVPTENPEEYFRVATYLPFPDHLLQEMGDRFDTSSKQALIGMKLIPKKMQADNMPSDFSTKMKEDHSLPDPNTLHHELRLWQTLWESVEPDDLPSTLEATLSHPRMQRLMYPNIYYILTVLLMAPVSAAGVERTNSSLRFIKNAYRSTMGDERFNALMLLYIHSDIPVHYGMVVNRFSQLHPRKMLLSQPLD